MQPKNPTTNNYVTQAGLNYAKNLVNAGHIKPNQLTNYALAYNKGLRLYAGLCIANNGKKMPATHGANLLSNQFWAYNRASAIIKITLNYVYFATQNNFYHVTWLHSLTKWLKAGCPVTTNPKLTSIW